MVIDSHTHILPPSFRRDQAALRTRDGTFATLFARGDENIATAEELIAAMDQDGVDASIVLGYGWCDVDIARDSNDYLLDSAERFPGRIIPFCSIHPDWGDTALKEVERCVTRGAVGIGELHPSSQGVDLALDPHLDPLMELAKRYRLPVLVHGSEPVGHQYPGKGNTVPEIMMEFISRYQEAIIICAHWGGGLPFYGLMPEIKTALKNVYFDTAATPLLYTSKIFSVITQTIGADHVLFGSDYPLIGAGKVIAQAKAALSIEELAGVLHNNTMRLLDGRN